MGRKKFLNEDLELQQIREAEQQLLRLEEECAKIPGKLAREQKEQESTMPPLAEIEDRKRRKAHDQMVSRGEVANILRDQNRSISLILFLLAATGASVWWGLKLMNG